MNNVLVTGGAGFVGSNLCEALVSLGHNVTSVDNYFTGSKNNHVDGVEYLYLDTRYVNDHVNLNKKYFDYVFHLGEYSRVEQSFDDFERVWKYNKLGLYEVLKFTKRNNAKLIYAGSSTKFADSDNKYIQSPYAWSKASNTEFVKKYAEWYGLDYAITYFYNVYGKREIATGDYATLIAKFAEKMRTQQPLTVVEPGTQIRNFTHVDDIINGLLLIAEYGHGDEYGIGHPKGYSVNEIAEMFGGEVEMLPARKGNRMSAAVVTTKTQNLGWVHMKNVKDYIEELRNKEWVM